MSYKNKHIINLLKYLILVTFITSCNPTKYVPDNKYLIKKLTIDIDNRKIEKKDLENYIKQKPNKKILGFRFHLKIYNLSNIDKNNGFNLWLRRIGEEPIILDEYLARKSADQLNLYLKNKGYYNAKVVDTIIYKKKKALIKYSIKTNEPYIINQINYKIEDTLLTQKILKDTLNSLIKKNAIFDVDILEKERKRIEEYIRKQGYYDFVKQYIYFEADTSLKNNAVNLSIGIKKYSLINENEKIIYTNHKLYKINNIYINPNYQPKMLVPNKGFIEGLIDTINYKGINFIIYNEYPFNKVILSQSIYIENGDLFNPIAINNTYSHLSSLKLYKLIDIQFKKNSKIDYFNPNDTAMLDCYINMTPAKSQSYSIEIEGTNSSGNIGGATNFIYQHKTLLNSYEELNIKFHGALESLIDTFEFNNAIELGCEARLNIHKFWLPFPTEQFIKKFNPKTSFALSYNYQKRPNYSGNIGNFEFGYVWQGNSFLTHALNPVEFNIVNIKKSSYFEEQIKNTYLEHSYKNHLVTVTSYTLIFNNQNLRKINNSIFIRYKIESAGNILWAFNKLTGKPQNEKYKLFGTDFSQFIKNDFETRYYNYIDENQKIAYRFFCGIGLPYGNSEVLPFEKKYFSGGANSIRAWKMRTVGPGSDKIKVHTDYPNQSADIKLEANVEYRFKMIWIMEGALFIDAGNIWVFPTKKIKENDGSNIEDSELSSIINTPDEALFKFNKFYKDIAIGTGFGLRFDFSFFIFRLDLGIKLRDPAFRLPSDPDPNKWILTNKSYINNKTNLTLGIGYPF